MAKTTNTRFQILCKLLECGAGGGNRTIRAYSFYVTYCKHTNARTAQPAVCPPPMYKIMYNKIGRCNVAHRLRLYLHACFSGASIPSVPGPCSIHRKARASTLCRHGNALGAFIWRLQPQPPLSDAHGGRPREWLAHSAGWRSVGLTRTRYAQKWPTNREVRSYLHLSQTKRSTSEVRSKLCRVP